jgi:hypothetical protein
MPKEGEMRNLQISGERLWASLMELAQIGATPKGGVCRLAARSQRRGASVLHPLVRGGWLQRPAQRRLEAASPRM